MKKICVYLTALFVGVIVICSSYIVSVKACGQCTAAEIANKCEYTTQWDESSCPSGYNEPPCKAVCRFLVASEFGLTQAQVEEPSIWSGHVVDWTDYDRYHIPNVAGCPSEFPDWPPYHVAVLNFKDRQNNIDIFDLHECKNYYVNCRTFSHYTLEQVWGLWFDVFYHFN